MRLYLLFVLLSLYPVFTQATDTVYVHETQLPILIERKDNVFFLMRLTISVPLKWDELNN